ncbi:MAG: DegT/DnrJ/EryC1/StrS family aminotransferase [Armatimonadetes bacterium]|nr:DegT/DnrJ/EryC1/StrS family aminotransferase [Armatimonadota bacterium]
MPIPSANPKAQIAALRNEIMAAVDEVFNSCQFILGPNVAALEEEVPAACDARFGIAVNSGTDAIVVALAAAGIGPGDEVITTPFTFVATAEAAMIVGARPVFADIDPTDFNLNPDLVEQKITSRTKAILPVHLYGQCAQVERMEQIAEKHGLVLVSDAAQAIGSEHKGRGIGAYGHAATLSFYPTKNLGGAGDGGMVLTNSEQIAEKAKSMRFHGTDNTFNYLSFSSAQYVGYCSRLDEIQAAVLRVKLKRLDEWNAARAANAAYYIETLKDLPLQLPIPKPENYHTYHQFTIRFARRDELKAKLAERGVGSAVFYPCPLHIQKAYADLGYKPGDFPEAERAAKEVLSLPVFPELSESDRKTVAEAVRECVLELA